MKIKEKATEAKEKTIKSFSEFLEFCLNTCRLIVSFALLGGGGYLVYIARHEISTVATATLIVLAGSVSLVYGGRVFYYVMVHKQVRG